METTLRLRVRVCQATNFFLPPRAKHVHESYQYDARQYPDHHVLVIADLMSTHDRVALFVSREGRGWMAAVTQVCFEDFVFWNSLHSHATDVDRVRVGAAAIRALFGGYVC
jgi:hypothetical protein